MVTQAVRRDVKPVSPLASLGMTETEYQAAVYAEREFGRIQVRQLTRKLAVDLGLPDDCMLPEVQRRGWPRMVNEMRIQEHVGYGVLRPEGHIVVLGSVA